MMVGDETPLEQGFEKSEGGEAILAVSNLSIHPEDPFAMPLKQISFDVRKGEILGIAGVAGNGQEELMSALSGEEMAADADIQLLQQPIAQLTPSQRRALGFAFVPEERLGRGAVPNMSLNDNALLSSSHCHLLNNGWIRRTEVSEFTSSIIKDYNVKCAGNRAQAKSLSGGNLQKFIIGREIKQNPTLLVCSHPTWGVDIGAAILIRKALIALRDQGAAILVISEDIDELYEICDRLGALCDGRLSPIKPTREVTIGTLGQWMTGTFDVTEEVCA
ncbi:MAG: ATP-binding cassette domain-containing protein, partial [Oleibacter sp.]|nr:ATP-binding cassette domain-containing protein [Thalassolituus sp.]